MTLYVSEDLHVNKGSSRFTELLTVVREVGLSMYLLSDGQKWNASTLTRFPREALACTSKDNESVLDGFTVSENMLHYAQEPGTRRTLRNRNPPGG